MPREGVAFGQESLIGSKDFLPNATPLPVDLDWMQTCLQDLQALAGLFLRNDWRSPSKNFLYSWYARKAVVRCTE